MPRGSGYPPEISDVRTRSPLLPHTIADLRPRTCPLVSPGRCAFLTYDPAPSPWMDGPCLCDLKARPHQSGHRRPILPWGIVRPLRLRSVEGFLSEHRVTAMLSEFGPFSQRLLPATEAAGTRLFVHFHGWDASRVLRKPSIVARYQKMFPRLSGVITPSQYIADKLIAIGCPEELVHIAACGVTPADFPPSARVSGRVLFVGRFVEKKAPLDALRAFIVGAKSHPEARLDMVGEGPLLEQARELAAASDLHQQITLHGRAPHATVKKLMGEASIYLQPSVTAPNGDVEGLPVAVLEAMCSGLTVLATRHSGIPEAVKHGISGLLVEERDFKGMGHHIDTCLSDPAAATEMGAAARERVLEKFTSAHKTEKLRRAMGISGG